MNCTLDQLKLQPYYNILDGPAQIPNEIANCGTDETTNCAELVLYP